MILIKYYRTLQYNAEQVILTSHLSNIISLFFDHCDLIVVTNKTEFQNIKNVHLIQC